MLNCYILAFHEKDSFNCVGGIVANDNGFSEEQSNTGSECLVENIVRQLIPKRHHVTQRVRPQHRRTVYVAPNQLASHVVSANFITFAKHVLHIISFQTRPLQKSRQ